jgi:hypothetical protein
VARTGPPDEFHREQTQYPNYGMGGYPPPAVPPGPPPEPPPERQEPPDYLDPLDQEVEPTPWYRKPVGLISWLVAVLILIGLIVYGIIELIQGGEGGGYTPGTSTTTTPATATSTTPSATPPTSSATTTTPTAPPTSSAVEPPAQQPTRQPTQQQPTHRHHLPPLPSVITIPEVPTVITLPPGLTD